MIVDIVCKLLQADVNSDEGSLIALTWDDVTSYYSEPHRVFHTVEHLKDGIEALVKWSQQLNSIPSIEQILAWFYHDVIYDVLSKSNEDLSAELAINKINQLASKNTSIDTEIVKTIILDTKSHEATIDESCIILDIDMISLSESDFDRFLTLRYRAEEEYLKEYPKEHVLKGCIQFAKSMVEKEYIFNLPINRIKEDPLAKENLRRYIVYLESLTLEEFHKS